MTTKVQSRKWTDDSQVLDCMGCGKAFSLTIRKVSLFCFFGYHKWY